MENRGTNTILTKTLGFRPDAWSTGALVVAILVLLPIMAVFWMALTPSENIWPHLVSTTLPRYVANSVIIVIGVGVMAAGMGTGSAWLVTMYRFPGSGLLQWMLLLPLAIPAYVGAYALVDFLEYAGPVQTALRTIFGWQTAREYWFPEIRSQGAAILVLASALYPYVFLFVRTALREQSGTTYEVSRALGADAFSRFRRIGLPLTRPAIAAGSAIVMMEAISDFGAVSYFSVQTLTTGIFTVWLEAGNRSGAAQIASLVLIGVIILIALEKSGRGKSRYYASSRQNRPIEAVPLRGWKAILASAMCTIPLLVGFVLPVTVILLHALDNAQRWLDPGLLRALLNTLMVGGIAAMATVVGAIFMVYGVRMQSRRLPRLLLPMTAVGYAAPGAVLGIGILFPLSRLDHTLADLIENLTGKDIGLLMTGTAFAIIFAYFVRFFAIAQGAVDSAFGRVSPSLPMASRSLGKTAGGTLGKLYIPLMRGSVATALLLVFVDCVKELPATLLLRPFNFDTLATRVYDNASLEQIGSAAPAALLVIMVGLFAVLFLARGQKTKTK